MVRRAKFTTSDVERVFRAHCWILLTCVLGLGALGAWAATQLPKQYTSRSVVWVARPAVSEDYAKLALNEDLTEPLASIKQEVLSRTRLQSVIEKLNLYVDGRAKVPMEDLVEHLRNAVEVSPLEGMPRRPEQNFSGFAVNVKFDNPRLAQQICTEINSLLREQNARALEQQFSHAVSWIRKQLEEANFKLNDQDARLDQFTRQHMELLPEETQFNRSVMATLKSQLEENTQALSRAQRNTAFNEGVLSQISQVKQNQKTLDEQLRTWQEQLAVLESRYTEGHPDVVRLRKEIAEIKSRKTTESARTQRLRARIREAEINQAELLKRQTKIRDEIRVLEGNIEASAMEEMQWKELTRNYQSALQSYKELLKKRDNILKALVHQRGSEQFRVLDSPSLPTTPAFPKMLNFAEAGSGAGAVLAFIILYLLMTRDKTLHTESDVETYLKLPVLARVPVLKASAGRSKDLKRTMTSTR